MNEFMAFLNEQVNSNSNFYQCSTHFKPLWLVSAKMIKFKMFGICGWHDNQEDSVRPIGEEQKAHV